ncbi:hypothetical protein [Tardiphaga sp.]|uniref:hypothetical protein n=1 Tax=Tardiphaga sp. TaxID=1926292 RepID=UPI0025D4B972|nr:hypothetical protein [Tardiphaga sp.]
MPVVRQAAEAVPVVRQEAEAVPVVPQEAEEVPVVPQVAAAAKAAPPVALAAVAAPQAVARGAPQPAQAVPALVPDAPRLVGAVWIASRQAVAAPRLDVPRRAAETVVPQAEWI